MDRIKWQERKDKWRKDKGKKGKGGGAGGTGDGEEEEDDSADPVRVKGCILVLLDVPSDLKYDKIKSFFKEHGAVAYVDTDLEQKKAFIRFCNENEAMSALKTASLSVEEEAAADSASKDVAAEEEAVDKEKAAEEEKAAGDSNGDAVESVSAADDALKPGEVWVKIAGSKYKAYALTGEDEVNHWISVNKIRKKAKADQKASGGRGDRGDRDREEGGGGFNGRNRSRGRGFKRGGGGYKGRNDRNAERSNGSGAGQKRKQEDVASEGGEAEPATAAATAAGDEKRVKTDAAPTVAAATASE